MANTIRVNSANVKYGDDSITSSFLYHHNDIVKGADGSITVTPKESKFLFETNTKVPKMGLMLVGLGGNNGTTVVAGCIANKLGIDWQTRRGVQKPNYYGSITQAGTMRIGYTADNEEINVPMSSLVPLVHPNDIVIGGWDISKMNLADGMERAGVLDVDLQRRLVPHMKDIVPLRSIYNQDFVAANQSDRADNVFPESSTPKEQLEGIRADIRKFKEDNGLDTIVVLWTATTERFCEFDPAVHGTKEAILAAIDAGHKEIAPSVIYAVASILEGCSYVNGAPQNTILPGVVDLAANKGVFVGGDDFKSGQTKFKSVLTDFLVGAGLKVTAIVSYNHLGNNDGRNLQAPQTFRSKELSKTNVVDDIVKSNSILYAPGEHPDHTVVIKYVPYVGDSKRALDEYTSEIFMGGINTIVAHNTCEDSLLAAPLIIDLAVLTELFERVTLRKVAADGAAGEPGRLHTVLTPLSYFLKAPIAPHNTPVVNALFRQRSCIESMLRALVGIPPEVHIGLEHKVIGCDCGNPLSDAEPHTPVLPH